MVLGHRLETGAFPFIELWSPIVVVFLFQMLNTMKLHAFNFKMKLLVLADGPAVKQCHQL